MAASISGNIDIVEKILSMGANINLKSCNDLMALDWAKRFTKNEIVQLIESYQYDLVQLFSLVFYCILKIILFFNINRYLSSNSNLHLNEFILEKDFINDNLKQIDDHLILKAYYRYLSNSSCLIDYKLIVSLLSKLLETHTEGYLFI